MARIASKYFFSKRRGFPALCIAAAFLVIAAYAAAAPHTFWSQSFRFNQDRHNYTAAVVVDGFDNIAVAARIGRDVGFPARYVVVRSIGVRKLDRDGGELWSRVLTSNAVMSVNAMDTDALGDVVVSGSMSGLVDFGGGIVDSLATTSGLVVKYDPDGNFLWKRTFTGTGRSIANEIAVDDDGSVVVVATFSGTVDFGGGPITSAGGDDIVMVRFDANGGYQWARQFGDALPQGGVDAAIDSNHRIVFLGEFEGTIDLGGASLTSAGSRDVFLAQFNADGGHRWSRAIGGTESEYALDVVVDSNDQPIMARGGFLTKFDVAGTELWSQAVATGVKNALAVGPGDDVFLLGYTALSARDKDGTLFSTNPSYAWPFVFENVAVDSAGDVVLGARVYTGENDAGEMYDVGVSKVALPEPFVVSLNDVPNDQGRALNMHMRPSRLDAAIVPAVIRYDVYLRDDPLPAGVQHRGGLQAARNLGINAPPGSWIFVVSLPADRSEAYDAVVPSLADSTISKGAYNSAYFVRAATADPAIYFDSQVASGYSKDNLPPSVPSNVVFSSHTLSWQGGGETDFDYFTVYGSDSQPFDEEAVLVTRTSQSPIVIDPSPYMYYHVNAVDFAGNESLFATGLGDDDEAPSSPRNLQYAAAILTWLPALDFDVNHYAVWGSMFDVYDGRAVGLGTTSELSFDVSIWPFPFYFVRTIDHAGNPSSAAIVEDSSPPAAPTNIQFDGRLVSWDASTDPGLLEYFVYGSMSNNFASAKTRLGRPTVTSFDVSGFAYVYFFVTVVDWTDNESAPAMVTDVFAPGAVVNLTYRSGLLSWEPPPQVDVRSYTIYGSAHDTFDQPKTLILETTDASYYAANDGFPYHYVTAVDLRGNEGPPARGRTPSVVFTLALTAFPNPFNPETTIRYEVPRAGHVTVAVYNARGALVTTLVDTSREAGAYDVEWSGIDAAGNPVGSGVYFARIDSSGDTKSRKLVLVK